jgi:hypothetical protein
MTQNRRGGGGWFPFSELCGAARSSYILNNLFKSPTVCRYLFNEDENPSVSSEKVVTANIFHLVASSLQSLSFFRSCSVPVILLTYIND